MAFSIDDVIETLESSYVQGGEKDFDAFLAENLTAQRWIIASDYNVGSPGSKHDVYAFACFPADRGLEELGRTLVANFPADFKRTGSITRAHRRFFDLGRCFCFVFFVPRSRKMLRDGADHRTDLAGAREMIRVSLEAAADGRASSPKSRSGSPAALHREPQEEFQPRTA